MFELSAAAERVVEGEVLGPEVIADQRSLVLDRTGMESSAQTGFEGQCLDRGHELAG